MDACAGWENQSKLGRVRICSKEVEKRQYLGYDMPFISFGESVFRKKSWAIHYNNNRYCLITKNGYLNNREEKYSTFSDWSLRERIDNVEEDVLLLKSFKQSYSKNMTINNLIIN